MGRHLLGCIFLYFAVNALSVHGFTHDHFHRHTKDPSELEDVLENELRLLRLELKRLNITHQIPGVCSVCKTVLGKVISLIPENETKEHLKTILHEVCKGVGVPRWICSQFVGNYHVQVIIDIVNKHMRDPRKICLVLRLCWWPEPWNKHNKKPWNKRDK